MNNILRSGDCYYVVNSDDVNMTYQFDSLNEVKQHHMSEQEAWDFVKKLMLELKEKTK